MSKLLTLAGAVPLIVLLACSDGSTAPVAANGVAPTLDVPTYVLARGAVVAQEYCARCHGRDLAGTQSDTLFCPSLSAMLDYSFAEFDNLLLRGMDTKSEVLNPMNTAAPGLQMEDRWAVYQYLRAKYGQ